MNMLIRILSNASKSTLTQLVAMSMLIRILSNASKSTLTQLVALCVRRGRA